MCATTPFLKLTHPYPILRGNSCESFTGPVKIYGKGAGSQLSVFTVTATGIFTLIRLLPFLHHTLLASPFFVVNMLLHLCCPHYDIRPDFFHSSIIHPLRNKNVTDGRTYGRTTWKQYTPIHYKHSLRGMAGRTCVNIISLAFAKPAQRVVKLNDVFYIFNWFCKALSDFMYK